MALHLITLLCAYSQDTQCATLIQGRHHILIRGPIVTYRHMLFTGQSLEMIWTDTPFVLACMVYVQTKWIEPSSHHVHEAVCIDISLIVAYSAVASAFDYSSKPSPALSLT